MNKFYLLDLWKKRY